MAEPDFARSRRQLRRARVQSALTMPNHGVNKRMNRDRLLEPLALERLNTLVAFEELSEDQVETLVSIALAEVTDTPQDTAFVLIECLNLLIRDGQFARIKILAQRLRTVAHNASDGRRFLELSISAIASSLSGNPMRAVSDLNRALGPDADVDQSQWGPTTRFDLAVAAAIRASLIDSNVSFAARTRDIADRVGDGLTASLIDAAIAWQTARVKADPLINLQNADPTFTDERLSEYLRKRGVEVLFPSQITAITDGLTTDEELTVALPTSSGKTLLAEFKIAATLARHPNATVVYVAPYRLLSRQVAREFRRHLSRLGHVVQDLGSGYDLDLPERFGNILVCTPERLDALLRQGASDSDAADALLRCKLVVFDEMHLIGRSGRGPRFEMLLTRLKLRYTEIHFLALSAASQGVDSVAQWLTSGRITRGARRPTGTIEVAWRTDGKLSQRVENRSTEVGELQRSKKPLNDAALLIARLSPDYRPVLAVCAQRAYAETLAMRLIEDDPLGSRLWIESLDLNQANRLDDAVDIVSSMMGSTHPLSRALQNGVGFHHAGVPSHVLGLIEDLAARRVLRAVCATTTVAEGADLPFRAVVIPHLNFQSNTRKLERDLYLNIIGRAGRVNVAMEGIVFILDSPAKTLDGYIDKTLWSRVSTGLVSGQLTSIPQSPQTPDEHAWRSEFESQIMGWLGDGDSYYENQSRRIAAGTFTYQSGGQQARNYVESLTQFVLESLEDRGFAEAGSPYRLTDRGERARATGLNSHSVARLERALSAGSTGWLPTITHVDSLDENQCDQIARVVYESTETMANSLWLRKTHKSDTARTAYLTDFSLGETDEHLDDEIFWSEVNALSLWLAGASLQSIADTMPVFGGNGLFGSSDDSSRVSDVAEYISKIGYPGSWTWTAAHTLARSLYGLDGPKWVSAGIEYGASTETAVSLMRRGGLSRPGALILADVLGSTWVLAAETIKEDDSLDLHVASIDRSRLQTLREALQREVT